MLRSLTSALATNVPGGSNTRFSDKSASMVCSTSVIVPRLLRASIFPPSACGQSYANMTEVRDTILSRVTGRNTAAVSGQTGLVARVLASVPERGDDRAYEAAMRRPRRLCGEGGRRGQVRGLLREVQSEARVRGHRGDAQERAQGGTGQLPGVRDQGHANPGQGVLARGSRSRAPVNSGG